MRFFSSTKEKLTSIQKENEISESEFVDLKQRLNKIQLIVYEFDSILSENPDNQSTEPEPFKGSFYKITAIVVLRDHKNNDNNSNYVHDLAKQLCQTTRGR